jgi:DNA repair protein RadC
MTGILRTSTDAGNYIIPKFVGARDELVYIICMDAKCKVLGCKLIGKGGVNSAGFSVREVIETALSYNAVCVILAHNHPSGIALPSEEDCATTNRVRDALAKMEIELVDHIVVADDDFVSMADNGFFHPTEKES